MMVKIFLFFMFFCTALHGGNLKKKAGTIDSKRFNYLDIPWDLKSLSSPPAFTWTDSTSTVWSLVYESVPFQGHPTKVFAYYSNPDLLMGINSGRTFPGIVLIHGGGGSASKDWVEKWAADGYSAISMDLGGLDGLGKPLALAGPDQSDFLKYDIIEKGDIRDVWSYHAVASVILAHSLLLSLPEVNNTKTCVTGLSWGGYVTCMVAALDNRFKAAVPVYGCGYYTESDVFKVLLSNLQPSLVDKWMKNFDPSIYLPFASPSLLFINGNTDQHYNIVPYAKTYSLPENCEKNICLKPGMKHGHLYGKQPIEIRYFFESVLNGGVPLPKVGMVKIKDSMVESGFSAVVGLRSASFYYSSDTLSLNANRVWSEIVTQIDPIQKRIFCKLPNENFKFGFFYVTDHREVSVSSPIFVKLHSEAEKNYRK